MPKSKTREKSPGPRKRPPAAADLLVEIGTEELPPKALKSLSSAFTSEICERLRECGLSYGEVTSFATPRRLAVVVSEETGGIALAVDGKLARHLTEDQLRRRLQAIFRPRVRGRALQGLPAWLTRR